MKVKHFITLHALRKEEIRSILDEAHRLKKSPRVSSDVLKGKVLGLIFEKPSLRTHVSFRAAMHELGGTSIYFGPEDIQMGEREPIKDLARVLSSYLECLVLRTFKHKSIEEFEKYAKKPVVNGLSDFCHPCQALTDLFTMEEKLGDLKNKKIVYVGDGNNVLTSLLFLFSKMGLDFTYATPKRYAPTQGLLRKVRGSAKASGAKIVGLEDPKEAVKGADVVYTDVWISMGEEGKAKWKMRHFKGFQVDSKLFRLANKKAIFMHCLPAHRGEEVTESVLEGKHSVVFEQAANRLPVEKAILLYLMG